MCHKFIFFLTPESCKFSNITKNTIEVHYLGNLKPFEANLLHFQYNIPIIFSTIENFFLRFLTKDTRMRGVTKPVSPSIYIYIKRSDQRTTDLRYMKCIKISTL